MAEIVTRAIDTLKPHPKNVRTHSKRQIRQIATSIEKFGLRQPVLVDENGVIYGTRDLVVHRRSSGKTLKLAGLLIKALQRGEFFVVAKFRLLHRRF